eukprot:TRINITY_DN373948_c0_g2_i1.p1 TRINITY_DN373948_c0_g2~~TRINITY_DN373948_c0_g2_i1.p1  ORF type:complete len:124 (-),score=22.86 TRINITY_DN373948_c0_g2_i1:700-1071(-)
MLTSTNITLQEATLVGNALGIDWNTIDIQQFRRGLEVELEHGLVDANSNVTNDDMLLTGKIALAHLNELSDYYTRLDMIENVKLNVAQNTQIPTTNSTIKNVAIGLALGASAVALFNYFKKRK